GEPPDRLLRLHTRFREAEGVGHVAQGGHRRDEFAPERYLPLRCSGTEFPAHSIDAIEEDPGLSAEEIEDLDGRCVGDDGLRRALLLLCAVPGEEGLAQALQRRRRGSMLWHSAFEERPYGLGQDVTGGGVGRQP